MKTSNLTGASHYNIYSMCNDFLYMTQSTTTLNGLYKRAAISRSHHIVVSDHGKKRSIKAGIFFPPNVEIKLGHTLGL
jgi:hypothetical protein